MSGAGASESESESDKSGETQLRNCEKHVAAQMPNTDFFTGTPLKS